MIIKILWDFVFLRFSGILLNLTFYSGLIIATLIFFQSSGQSRKELIELGDIAFENGNYNASSYFYGKAVGSYESGEDERAYPYDFMPWIKPLKEKPDSGLNQITSEDTLRNEFPPQKYDPLFGYALFRLAESYRLNHDYENSEKIFELALGADSVLYPLVPFYYGLSLKNN